MFDDTLEPPEPPEGHPAFDDRYESIIEEATDKIIPFPKERSRRVLDEQKALIPPHNLKAEGAVLGCVMLDPLAMPLVFDQLRPHHFYAESHRRVYEACTALHERREPIDNITVMTWLRDQGRLDQVGGAEYVTTLLLEPASVRNLLAYAASVHNKWRLRAAITAMQLASTRGYADVGDIDAYLSDVRTMLEFPSAFGASKGPCQDVLSGSDLDGDLPPVSYLVREIGLVAGGGAPHLVAGYGFSGKTMALQSLMLSMAAGRPAWGGFTARPCRVIHVDLEQGRNLTQRRYQRLARAMGVRLSDLGDRISVVAMPRGLKLDESCRAQWLELMTGREVMVLDSLRAATGGQDENSSDIRAPIDMLGSLSEETGCRVIVIHHARKTQEGAPNGGAQAVRGSSAIFDACDGVYVFSAEKGEPIKIECVKARTHGEEVREAALQIVDVPSDEDPKWAVRVQAMGIEAVHDARNAKQVASQAVQMRKESERVREFVMNHPGAYTREIRDFLGLNGHRFARAIEALGADVEKRTDNGKIQRYFMRGAS